MLPLYGRLFDIGMSLMANYKSDYIILFLELRLIGEANLLMAEESE